MIVYDEIKDKEKLTLWWNYMLNDVHHSYPIVDFSKFDKNFKMKTCVDIGCNVGCFSFMASKHFDKVVSFEPGYFTSVVARMRVNQKEKINNVFIHNLAVGKNTGDIVKLSCSYNNGQLNSGNASTAYNSNKEEYELVTTVSLETIFDLCESDFIDYLKIDCEGSEYDILLDKDLTNIGIITGEIHGHPTNDFDESRNLLLSHISQNFNIVATRHNFFAVNKKFDIEAEKFFTGQKYEA
jgi:FkbM family methyltransferase